VSNRHVMTAVLGGCATVAVRRPQQPLSRTAEAVAHSAVIMR